jgi:hypothetical protein
VVLPASGNSGRRCQAKLRSFHSCALNIRGQTVG